MRRASTGYSRDASTSKDSEGSRKVDEPVQGPSMKSLIQYFENAGSVSVERTPGILWTFVTTDSRRFARGSALMWATMSESPVVPMISWIVEPPFRSIPGMRRNDIAHPVSSVHIVTRRQPTTASASARVAEQFHLPPDLRLL